MESLEIQKLNERFSGSSAQEVLAYFLSEYKGHIGLASSLSYEDQVLTAMICEIDKSCRIFTLDTGRVFAETYSLISKTNDRYGIKLEVFFPDYHLVQQMVSEHGVNLFYESIELRRECCHIRKLEPLKRAFEGLKVWICGLRHEQSVTRSDNQMVEWDSQNGILKINPLINWSEAEVRDYVLQNQVPYNVLHDKGFPSIGCQPCTRAVREGEDLRAGRWWWENPEQRECGLHNSAK
ncbi:MAG: phosphoadenylyl-sulfate reductase [Rikenellaceae bacterium]